MDTANKKIIILIIIAVLVIGGGIGLTVYLKNSKNNPPANTQESIEALPPQDSMQAVVTQVNVEGKYLMIKEVISNQAGKEYKASIADTTKIIKLALPFDPKNPPKDNVPFTPEQTEIKISGVQVGDDIFLKSKDNFAGKNEINQVDYIQILL